MYFWANSRCRIENCVKKAAVCLHLLYIIGLKIVPRDFEEMRVKPRTCEHSKTLVQRTFLGVKDPKYECIS